MFNAAQRALRRAWWRRFPPPVAPMVEAIIARIDALEATDYFPYELNVTLEEYQDLITTEYEDHLIHKAKLRFQQRRVEAQMTVIMGGGSLEAFHGEKTCDPNSSQGAFYFPPLKNMVLKQQIVVPSNVTIANGVSDDGNAI